jgi:hypothetical protein
VHDAHRGTVRRARRQRYPNGFDVATQVTAGGRLGALRSSMRSGSYRSIRWVAGGRVTLRNGAPARMG